MVSYRMIFGIHGSFLVSQTFQRLPSSRVQAPIFQHSDLRQVRFQGLFFPSHQEIPQKRARNMGEQ